MSIVSELALLLVIASLVIPGSMSQSLLADAAVANTTTSGTTSNNTQTFSNPFFGIKMQYPSNWSKLDLSRNSSSVLIVVFKTAAGVNQGSLTLLGGNVSSGNVTLTSLFNADINHLNQTGKILHLISSIPATFAGYPAHKIVYTTILPQRVEFEVMKLISLADNKAYFIIYAAPIMNYTTYLPTIHTMINSIKINQ
jgi:PsbP-like protein